MNRRILLVTGSRALFPENGGTWKSYYWAYDELHKRIVLDPNPPALIVNGGAIGPDRLSSAIAKRAQPRVAVREFRMNGFVYAVNNTDEHKLGKWSSFPRSPLERNAFMIGRCPLAIANGWEVEVLGLVASWSKTHGTSHTLMLARRAGLKTTRLEYGGQSP